MRSSGLFRISWPGASRICFPRIPQPPVAFFILIGYTDCTINRNSAGILHLQPLPIAGIDYTRAYGPEGGIMYSFTKDGKFVIDNYNWATSFASFLPGIAGKFGIPLWTYYVSRNQGVCSAGVRDKNHQILEFLPFNKALECVGLQGFRTFIKSKDGIYEPFLKTDSSAVSQTMIVSSAELELREKNTENGLETGVLYFQLPGDSYPGLARRLSLKNSGDTDMEFELIDGLPRILAYGMDQHCVTVIARHVEGMIEVDNSLGVPLYRLKQSPADTEKVEKIEGGNFYISFSASNGSVTHGKYFYDPAAVFKDAEIYSVPWNFKTSGVDAMLKGQIGQNRTSCAMTGQKVKLAPGEQFVLYSLVGFAPTDSKVKEICSLVTEEYLKEKMDENFRLIESIKNRNLIFSADTAFDQYCGQTFLDNVIRGGMPAVYPTADSRTAFYCYSRQNGDLERDYHHFIVEPTYLSQGTGHYRSVNQNRRADTWFFPETEDRNLVTFMNLIQFDGYNPLELTQMTYAVKDRAGVEKWIDKEFSGDAADGLKQFFQKSFAPGEAVMELERLGAASGRDYDAFLSSLLSYCVENECGGVHEGFWTDHWLYNFDLIENYLMIYPDRVKELFLYNREYYFYDDPDVVVPRDRKYVLVGNRVFQYNAVVRDPEKVAMIGSRERNPMMARTEYGKGEVYRTNLLVKLLCQIANRAASIDPQGIGIEMESDKPGWNDSMNGLPGIIGSSLCQMVELENICNILTGNLERMIKDGVSEKVPVYQELAAFMSDLKSLMEEKLASASGDRDFVYWDSSNSLKEKYRETTKFGIGGAEAQMGLDDILSFIKTVSALIAEIYTDEKKAHVFDPQGVPYTYYRNVVTDYEFIQDDKDEKLCSATGHPYVRAKAFEHKKMPLFLEGAVHIMKVHPEMRETVYKAVKGSNIYDKKLRMYKVCESLADAPFEIGRVKAWGSGWIENESVYTHMLYKYLLEIIRSGLHREYFEDIKTMMMCFLKPEVYGRSPLENVSFIVSSAFPDESQHGRGLQARLSGVTGEMIHQWILMAAGKQPFFLNGSGELNFRLEPVFPEWLFTKEESERIFVDCDEKRVTVKVPADSIVVRLFSRILVTFRNESRKDTFGSDGAGVQRYELIYADGKRETVDGTVVGTAQAKAIRDGLVDAMEVVLG